MSVLEDRSLRDRQIGKSFVPIILHPLPAPPPTNPAILERMLHLNKEGDADLTLASKKEEIIWKVLVLDAKSQAVLSSVLRVNDLLRCGITVHTVINSRRLPLPDVPVIYFVEPTLENIRVIIDDLAADKYDKFYINFTFSINRELLEDFAKKVSLTGKASKIKQVYDQYLDFIVTEPNLFLLDIPRVFSTFNNPATKEDDIHALAGKIADGILSTIIATASVPIIRCPRNGAAELVATQLDLKLRDYLSNTRNLINQLVQQRPVLVILDRSIDLSAMLSHSWIYQCMVSDVFELKRNTIRLVKFADDKETVKNYDIDPKDFFWSKNSALPFPDVVENADIELNAYKKDAQDLTNKTGITSFSVIDPNSTDTLHIQQAVDALPELTARKATLDMHMDVLATLLKELEAKSLDKFFEIEQNCHDPKIQNQFLELINTSAKRDNSTDKLRTLLILVLTLDLPESFVANVQHILKEKYPTIDLAALEYVKGLKQRMKLSNISTLTENSGHRSSSVDVSKNNSALFNGLSSKLYGLADGRLTEGLSSLASGLKKFLPAKTQLPVTNIVEAIMDPNSASTALVQVTDDYLYLDPKLRGGHSKPPKRQTYLEAQVFVVGGGSYLEYQNLQEWCHMPNKPVRRVTYGSTDVMTATEFLHECGDLGRL